MRQAQAVKSGMGLQPAAPAPADTTPDDTDAPSETLSTSPGLNQSPPANAHTAADKPMPPGQALAAEAPYAPRGPGIVGISTTTQRAAYEAVFTQRDTLMRRLLHCQQQRAHFGILLPSAIAVEIQDIERDLAQLDAQLALYQHSVATRADCALILSEAQQREAVLALARITGVPPDEIRRVDIVRGSVVLIVELPLVGAARLLALQRLDHPMLQAQGFARVALDQVIAAQATTFERAVRLAQAELESPTPPDTTASHPYAAVRGTARLRVTLAEATA